MRWRTPVRAGPRQPHPPPHGLTLLPGDQPRRAAYRAAARCRMEAASGVTMPAPHCLSQPLLPPTAFLNSRDAETCRPAALHVGPAPSPGPPSRQQSQASATVPMVSPALLAELSFLMNFFPLPFSPLYPLPQHHTLVPVHESFCVFAQSLHSLSPTPNKSCQPALRL